MGELKNEFAWSLTRHAMLLECPRKYHFRQHAFWGGWEAGASDETREIYRLTKLEQRATWRGRAVHSAVAEALQHASAGRPVENEADFAEAVVDRMREEFRDSLEDRARKSGRFKWHLRLFEHERGLDDGSERWRARWRENAEDVRRAMAAFFAHPLYRDTLRELPAAEWIEIEDPRASVGPSFDCDGVKVYVKVDCAFREDGRAVVVDWKTGRRASPLSPVQLAAYALYLQERHGVAPGSVQALEVGLLTGTVVEHDVGEEALRTFRSVLAESVARMRSLLVDVRGNVAKPAGDFPFTDDPEACARCEFASLCPKVSPAF